MAFKIYDHTTWVFPSCKKINQQANATKSLDYIKGRPIQVHILLIHLLKAIASFSSSLESSMHVIARCAACLSASQYAPVKWKNKQNVLMRVFYSHILKLFDISYKKWQWAQPSFYRENRRKWKSNILPSLRYFFQRRSKGRMLELKNLCFFQALVVARQSPRVFLTRDRFLFSSRKHPGHKMQCFFFFLIVALQPIYTLVRVQGAFQMAFLCHAVRAFLRKTTTSSEDSSLPAHSWQLALA